MPLQKHRYERTEPEEGGLHRLSRLQTFSFETRTNSTPIIRLDSVLRFNPNNNTTESLDSLLERPSEEEAAEEGNDDNSKQDPSLVGGRSDALSHEPIPFNRATFRQAANTSPPPGHLGRPIRYRESSQLVSESKVDSNNIGLVLHLHLSLLVDDGHTGPRRHRRSI